MCICEGVALLVFLSTVGYLTGMTSLVVLGGSLLVVGTANGAISLAHDHSSWGRKVYVAFAVSLLSAAVWMSSPLVSAIVVLGFIVLLPAWRYLLASKRSFGVGFAAFWQVVTSSMSLLFLGVFALAGLAGARAMTGRRQIGLPRFVRDTTGRVTIRAVRISFRISGAFASMRLLAAYARHQILGKLLLDTIGRVTIRAVSMVVGFFGSVLHTTRSTNAVT